MRVISKSPLSRDSDARLSRTGLFAWCVSSSTLKVYRFIDNSEQFESQDKNLRTEVVYEVLTSSGVNNISCVQEIEVSGFPLLLFLTGNKRELHLFDPVSAQVIAVFQLVTAPGAVRSFIVLSSGYSEYSDVLESESDNFSRFTTRFDIAVGLVDGTLQTFRLFCSDFPLLVELVADDRGPELHGPLRAMDACVLSDTGISSLCNFSTTSTQCNVLSAGTDDNNIILVGWDTKTLISTIICKHAINVADDGHKILWMNNLSNPSAISSLTGTIPVNTVPNSISNDSHTSLGVLAVGMGDIDHTDVSYLNIRVEQRNNRNESASTEEQLISQTHQVWSRDSLSLDVFKYTDDGSEIIRSLVQSNSRSTPLSSGAIKLDHYVYTGAGHGIILWNASQIRRQSNVEVKILSEDLCINTGNIATNTTNNLSLFASHSVGFSLHQPQLCRLFHAVVMPVKCASSAINGNNFDGGLTVSFLGCSIDGSLCLHTQHWTDIHHENADPGRCLEQLAMGESNTAGDFFIRVNNGDEGALADVSQLIKSGFLDRLKSEDQGVNETFRTLSRNRTSSFESSHRQSADFLEESLLELALRRHFMPAICNALPRLSNPRVIAVWAKRRSEEEYIVLKQITANENQVEDEMMDDVATRCRRASELEKCTQRIGALFMLAAALVRRSHSRDPEFGLNVNSESCSAIESRMNIAYVKRQQATALKCFVSPFTSYDTNILRNHCDARRENLKQYEVTKLEEQKQWHHMANIAGIYFDGIYDSKNSTHSRSRSRCRSTSNGSVETVEMKNVTSIEALNLNVGHFGSDLESEDSSKLFIDRIISLINNRIGEIAENKETTNMIQYPPNSLWELLEMYERVSNVAEITQTVHSVILYTVIDMAISRDPHACPTSIAFEVASTLKLPAVLRDVLLSLWRLDSGHEPEKSASLLSSPLVTALEGDIGVAVVRSFLRHKCSYEALQFLRCSPPQLNTSAEKEMKIIATLSCDLWQEALVEQRRILSATSSALLSKPGRASTDTNTKMECNRLRERLLYLLFTWFWDKRDMDKLTQLPLDRNEQDVLVRFLWIHHCNNARNGYDSMESENMSEMENCQSRQPQALSLLIGFLLLQNRIGEALWLHEDHIRRHPEISSAPEVSARHALLEGYCRTLPEAHCKSMKPEALSRRFCSHRLTSDAKRQDENDSKVNDENSNEDVNKYHCFKQTPVQKRHTVGSDTNNSSHTLSGKSHLTIAKSRLINTGYSPGQVSLGQSPLVHRSTVTNKSCTIPSTPGIQSCDVREGFRVDSHTMPSQQLRHFATPFSNTQTTKSATQMSQLRMTPSSSRLPLHTNNKINNTTYEHREGLNWKKKNLTRQPPAGVGLSFGHLGGKNNFDDTADMNFGGRSIGRDSSLTVDTPLHNMEREKGKNNRSVRFVES